MVSTTKPVKFQSLEESMDRPSIWADSFPSSRLSSITNVIYLYMNMDEKKKTKKLTMNAK
jgi:hypothetical protein